MGDVGGHHDIGCERLAASCDRSKANTSFCKFVMSSLLADVTNAHQLEAAVSME